MTGSAISAKATAEQVRQSSLASSGIWRVWRVLATGLAALAQGRQGDQVCLGGPRREANPSSLRGDQPDTALPNAAHSNATQQATPILLSVTTHGEERKRDHAAVSELEPFQVPESQSNAITRVTYKGRRTYALFLASVAVPSSSLSSIADRTSAGKRGPRGPREPSPPGSPRLPGRCTLAARLEPWSPRYAAKCRVEAAAAVAAVAAQAA